MLDLRCYFITGHGSHEQIVETARQAALGGAGMIQVRSKPISARALYDLGLAVV
ncbi:thiamine phosphate synthase, partial [Corynebacterium tuscaniense]